MSRVILAVSISLILKATPATDPILAAAEKMEPDVARAFIQAVAAAKAKIDMKALAQAIQNNDQDAAMEILGDVTANFAAALEGAGIPAGSQSFKDVLQATFAAGGTAAITALPPSIVTTNLRFDMTNPEAIEHLNTYAFDLIQQVTQDQRDAIQQIVTRAFEEGGHPIEQARSIREIIGLTSKQEQAVANYREALEGGNYRDALSRALRDARFDPTLRGAIQSEKPLSQEYVDKLVGRYREKYLKYRAENLARTETARASAQGQRALWNQASKQGLLPKTTKRIWIASVGDPRTCEDCLDLADSDPVGLDEPFEDGTMDAPQHCSCRCSTAIDPDSLDSKEDAA